MTEKARDGRPTAKQLTLACTRAGEVPADGQAEADSAAPIRQVCRELDERLEDRLELFGGNTRSCVGDVREDGIVHNFARQRFYRPISITACTTYESSSRYTGSTEVPLGSQAIKKF